MNLWSSGKSVGFVQIFAPTGSFIGSRLVILVRVKGAVGYTSLQVAVSGKALLREKTKLLTKSTRAHPPIHPPGLPIFSLSREYLHLFLDFLKGIFTPCSLTVKVSLHV